MTNNFKRYIFIRNDDVYQLDKRFLKTFELCLNEKIPIVYGIIPNKLKKDMVEFLREKKTNYPSYLDIVQHGWSHKNHNRTSKIRYEFGLERSYNQQKKDIKLGYHKMTSEFGKSFTPAFIPPYHFYNSATIKIIDELNFPIFSAGIIKQPLRNVNFIYLPAQVSINRYTSNFESLPLSLSTMMKETIHYINSCRVVGIYFHYNTLNNYNFDIFTRFIVFLKKIATTQKIKFILFSDILRMINYSGKF